MYYCSTLSKTDCERLLELLFSSLELPAGVMVKFLVGFYNKGDKDFIVETLDASFRYPMDYTFYIQNVETDLVLSLLVLTATLISVHGGHVQSSSSARTGGHIRLRFRPQRKLRK